MAAVSLGKKKSTQIDLRAQVFSAIKIMEQRFSDPPSVKELASEVGLSAPHFRQVFQAVVGEPYRKHCLRIRLERAANLLFYSDLPLGRIGEVCGFGTAASFSRGFKRQYGMSPGEYRSGLNCRPFLRESTSETRLTTSSLSAYPSVTLEDWPSTELICLRIGDRLSTFIRNQNGLVTRKIA